MGQLGSQEAITSFAGHMCDTKVKTMPAMLATPYRTMSVKLVERTRAFEALLDQKQAVHRMTIDPEECLRQVKEVAKRATKSVSKMAKNCDSVEYFKLSAKITQVEKLNTLVHTLAAEEAEKLKSEEEWEHIIFDVLGMKVAITTSGMAKNKLEMANRMADEGVELDASGHLATAHLLSEIRVRSEELTKDLPKMETALGKLKDKLCVQYTFLDNNGNNGAASMESRLLDAGRDELGQAVMESIQDQMEAITFAALRHRSDCVKKGATAKQKAKYVSNMVVRAKELRAVITKYNSVVVHFPESGYTATSFNEIKGGEFQWTEPRARNHIAACNLCCGLTSQRTVLRE